MGRNETGYIKYITDWEREKIKKYIEGLRSPSMKMLLKILLYTGIRTSEAITLKRSNFSPDYSIVRYELLKRKQKVIKERAIPSFLQPELKKYVHAWQRRIKGSYLFFPTYGNNSSNPHLTGASVRDRFKLMRRKLGITDVYHECENGKKLHRLSPHTLRHYAIWRIYKASGNCIITARDIIGHKKLETTARYCRSLEAINSELAIINRAWA